MEGLPGWAISSMPGSRTRQHEHEIRYTPFTHPFILGRGIWKDDYDGHMIFGTRVGLKLPDIGLTDEEKPRKNLTHPGNLSRQGIEPEPAALQACMLAPTPQRWTKDPICLSKSWIKNPCVKSQSKISLITFKKFIPYYKTFRAVHKHYFNIAR